MFAIHSGYRLLPAKPIPNSRANSVGTNTRWVKVNSQRSKLPLNHLMCLINTNKENEMQHRFCAAHYVCSQFVVLFDMALCYWYRVIKCVRKPDQNDGTNNKSCNTQKYKKQVLSPIPFATPATLGQS